MDRIAALLEKELRHHIGTLVGLFFTLPMAYLMTLLGVVSSPDNITILTTHQVFLWVFVPLTGMVLGHRLVVVEYHGRTQLFVESLPLRRGEMVTVKYVLGLLIIMSVAIASLLFSSLFALGSEPLGARFMGLMTLRTMAYTFCVWSVLFSMGFLGRFRVPIYVGLVILVFALDTLTELELRRFGPFAMVDQQLVLERVMPPSGSALATTLILGAAWVALAYAMALINEGSVAESLARRMTLKEKSAVGVLFIAALSATTVLEDRRQQAPFSFQEDEVLRSTTIPLEILYLHESALSDAEMLRDQVESDLSSLAQTLSRDEAHEIELPPIRIALRESLDARTFEPVGLSKNDGLLVRANFRSSEAWASGGNRSFRAFLIREVLSELTDGRAEYEPKAWIHDGFSRFWADRDRLDACRQSPASCTPLLRALWATRGRRDVRDRQLERWFRTRERHGEDIAWSLAFSGLLVLEERHGREAVIALARRLYARSTPSDLRELVHERLNPMSVVFEAAIGVPYDEFLMEWNAELDRLRELSAVATALASIPEATGKLTIERDVGAIRNAVVRLDLRRHPTGGPRPSGSSAVVSLLHRDLTPFDQLLERHELRREERLVQFDELTTELQLLGRYGPGMRIFVALELESELLGCPIRVLAERRVLR